MESNIAGSHESRTIRYYTAGEWFGRVHGSIGANVQNSKKLVEWCGITDIVSRQNNWSETYLFNPINLNGAPVHILWMSTSI